MGNQGALWQPLPCISTAATRHRDTADGTSNKASSPENNIVLRSMSCWEEQCSSTCVPFAHICTKNSRRLVPHARGVYSSATLLLQRQALQYGQDGEVLLIKSRVSAILVHAHQHDEITSKCDKRVKCRFPVATWCSFTLAGRMRFERPKPVDTCTPSSFIQQVSESYHATVPYRLSRIIASGLTVCWSQPPKFFWPQDVCSCDGNVSVEGSSVVRKTVTDTYISSRGIIFRRDERERVSEQFRRTSARCGREY